MHKSVAIGLEGQYDKFVPGRTGAEKQLAKVPLKRNIAGGSWSRTKFRVQNAECRVICFLHSELCSLNSELPPAAANVLTM